MRSNRLPPIPPRRPSTSQLSTRSEQTFALHESKDFTGPPCSCCCCWGRERRGRYCRKYRGTRVSLSTIGGVRISLRANFRAPNQFEFKIFRPRPHNEEPIELRPENRVVVGIIIKQPNKAGLPWSSIQLLDAGPAKSSKIRGGAKLYLILEVHGATTGTHFVAACRNCSRKVSSASSSSSLFDFVAKDGLIAIVGGTAELGFRFRCLPRHHGTADTEYR